jgi:polyferredoxin
VEEQVSSLARSRQILKKERTRVLRRLTQAGFGLLIIATSILHYAVTSQHMASIDAYCPFGGFETLWRWASSGGLFVQMTHGSNLVLALGLIAGVILAGGAFCGWICPFGAFQDLLGWLRKKLHLPEVRVPARLDRVLTYGRYVSLAVILAATIASVKLWFAGWDPYRTIFGLGWIFEFNLAEHWLAYLVAVVVTGAALVIPRAWCRYACPLGGAISLLGNLSLLRIRRTQSECRGCAVCNRPCPVKIDVAHADVVSADCIGCLECVEACPHSAALGVTLGPALPKLLRPRKEESVA